MNKIVIAPIEVITDSELSDPERRVLLILYSFKGKLGESVFPSIDVVAEMAGYADKTRISKITKSLELKGWLTKKRRGFTGGNSYRLIVPEAKLAQETKLAPEAKLAQETKLAPEAKLAQETKLAPEAKLDDEANTKLAPEAKSKLVSEAKYNEQPIEQPIEQPNNTIDIKSEKTVKPKNQELDYSCWPNIPDQQILIDWIALRKRLKADVNQTIINSFGKEFNKAKTFGLTVDDCLTECITRNWRGFKLEWLQNSSHGLPPKKPAAGTLNFTSTDYNNGINDDGSF